MVDWIHLPDTRRKPVLFSLLFKRSTAKVAAVILLLLSPSIAATQVVHVPSAERVDLSSWEFTDQDQETIKIGDLSGKVVVIEFWTVACPGCMKSLPKLLALQKSATAKDRLEIIPCNADTQNWPIGVKRFIARNRKALPDLRYFRTRTNEKNRAGRLIDPIAAFPTTLVLDGQGRLAVRWAGYNEKTLVAEINRLFSEMTSS